MKVSSMGKNLNITIVYYFKFFLHFTKQFYNYYLINPDRNPIN